MMLFTAVFMLVMLVPVILSLPSGSGQSRPSSSLVNRAPDELETAAVQISASMLNSGLLTTMTGNTNVLTRSSRAKIKFNCPQGGIFQRTFVWEARFSFQTYEIRLLGHKLIDRFDPIVVTGTDFSAYFHHSWCHVIKKDPPTVCFYHVRSQTFGTVWRDKIDLDLTTDSERSAENPSVIESCLDFQGLTDPNTCPAEQEAYNSHPCTITAVRVWGFGS